MSDRRPWINIDSSRDILVRRATDPLRAVEDAKDVRTWWESQISQPFRAKVQAWFPDVGSADAAEAGMRTERDSHDFAELLQADQLELKLKSGLGHHYKPEPILFEAKRDLREMRHMHSTDSTDGFLNEFVEILGRAYSLSPTRMKKLRTLIPQGHLRFS